MLYNILILIGENVNLGLKMTDEKGLNQEPTNLFGFASIIVKNWFRK